MCMWGCAEREVYTYTLHPFEGVFLVCLSVCVNKCGRRVVSLCVALLFLPKATTYPHPGTI